MVKVVDKTSEEREREEALKSLQELTEGLFVDDKYQVNHTTDCSLIWRGARHIISTSHGNVPRVRVYSPAHFDQAMALAEAFEDHTGVEYTLRREY